ncbi:hypothetical protein JW949_00095 [Candidatus Woesearchaeota archaeon]|nr:hypothetical protein [Candidatus Woesearchaeota archaeon]
MNKKIIIIPAAITVMIVLYGFIPFTQEIPEENGKIEVFFCPEDNCSMALIKEIENSSFVKCAFYDLDLKPLINTLKMKKASVIIDEDNVNEENEIFNVDYGSGLMHNKFCVFDKGIITGSFNPTENGNYKNNNNMLVIHSQTLKENYLDEFEELENNEKQKKTRTTKLSINGILIENYFCPEDNCEKEVLEELEKAEKSIYFMVFSFTSKNIGNKLVEKHEKGIEIKGVFEKFSANTQYSEYKKLKQNNIKVSLDKNPDMMHHKVFIIDNKTVITGSYNPTKSANEKNDENILIIHSENITKEFLKEFEFILNKA